MAHVHVLLKLNYALKGVKIFFQQRVKNILSQYESADGTLDQLKAPFKTAIEEWKRNR